MSGKHTIQGELGSIQVSDEVVSAIVWKALENLNITIDGPTGIGKVFRQKGSSGVNIQAGEDGITIKLCLTIDGNTPIPETALFVQKKVKEAVESVTGLKVQSIEIQVQGIRFAENQPAEP